MNKFQRFLGRISAETGLKMDYFGSKYQKIANRQSRPLFRLHDWRMRKTLLPLKLLVDADAWQFWGKTKFILYIFSPSSPPPQQTSTKPPALKEKHRKVVDAAGTK